MSGITLALLLAGLLFVAGFAWFLFCDERRLQIEDRAEYRAETIRLLRQKKEQ